MMMMVRFSSVFLVLTVTFTLLVFGCAWNQPKHASKAANNMERRGFLITGLVAVFGGIAYANDVPVMSKARNEELPLPFIQNCTSDVPGNQCGNMDHPQLSPSTSSSSTYYPTNRGYTSSSYYYDDTYIFPQNVPARQTFTTPIRNAGRAQRPTNFKPPDKSPQAGITSTPKTSNSRSPIAPSNSIPSSSSNTFVVDQRDSAKKFSTTSIKNPGIMPKTTTSGTTIAPSPSGGKQRGIISGGRVSTANSGGGNGSTSGRPSGGGEDTKRRANLKPPVKSARTGITSTPKTSRTGAAPSPPKKSGQSGKQSGGRVRTTSSRSGKGGSSGRSSGGGGRSSGSRSSGGGSRGSGGGTGSSCFPAGEMVDLLHNQRTPIDLLQPGQITQRGGKVEAVMKLLPAEQLYRYNNSVWVTGSHKVLEHNEWVYPKDSNLAQAVSSSSKQPDFHYNLITDKHQVIINNTIFSDWDEVDDPSDYASEQRLLARLNREEMNMDSSTHAMDDESLEQSQQYSPLRTSTIVVDEGGFAASTPIMKMNKNGNRLLQTTIAKLEPGDKLEDGDTVLGVIRLSVPNGTDIYSYEASGTPQGNAITVTEWTIVRHDGKWQHIRDCASKAAFSFKLDRDEVFYQLITTSNRLSIGDTMFADFEVV